MDPYLESPVLWSGFHLGMIGTMRAVLNTLLPQHYCADLGVRTCHAEPNRLTDDVEVREVFIEVLPVGDETRVVTIIELLSYANKAVGSEGRELYLAKQRQLLRSDVHFIEIDLLRSGEHTVAAPRAWLNAKQPWDYLVCLHRSGQRGRYETWPVTLREPLPRINVPLEND